MEQYKICVFLFSLIPLNMAVTDPQELKFQKVSNFIELRKGQPIDYADRQICIETHAGEDKIACRINGESTVDFLVCKVDTCLKNMQENDRD